MFKLYQLRAEILQTPLPPPFPFPRPFWLGPPTWRQSWQADILWTISHSHLDAGAGWPLFVPCCGVFRYTFAHNVFRVTTFFGARCRSPRGLASLSPRGKGGRSRGGSGLSSEPRAPCRRRSGDRTADFTADCAAGCTALTFQKLRVEVCVC